MKIFKNISVDIENLIWEYTGLFKLRNGILISQISKPPKNRIFYSFSHLNAHFYKL
jgi:hypothetical protein